MKMDNDIKEGAQRILNRFTEISIRLESTYFLFGECTSSVFLPVISVVLLQQTDGACPASQRFTSGERRNH